MKVVLITQARYGSTRLEGKVLKKINGRTLLSIHLENAKRAKLVSDFVVATTNETNADLIIKESEKMGWLGFIGSTDNVLNRFYESVKNLDANWIVRVTSDCPFVQSTLIDKIINEAIVKDYDYISTSLNFPDGVDVEVFKYKMLKMANEQSELPSDKEHVTPWIKRNAIRSGFLEPATNIFKDVRLTVDEIADFDCIEYLINKFGYSSDWKLYAQFVSENLELFTNQTITRNEGYIKSIKEESK